MQQARRDSRGDLVPPSFTLLLSGCRFVCTQICSSHSADVSPPSTTVCWQREWRLAPHPLSDASVAIITSATGHLRGWGICCRHCQNSRLTLASEWGGTCLLISPGCLYTLIRAVCNSLVCRRVRSTVHDAKVTLPKKVSKLLVVVEGRANNDSPRVCISSVFSWGRLTDRSCVSCWRANYVKHCPGVRSDLSVLRVNPKLWRSLTICRLLIPAIALLLVSISTSIR